MNRASLEELLRAAEELVEFERLCIIGSASLLVEHPSLGEVDQPLALSLDAYLVLLPGDADKARVLLATLGRGRPFANERGFHADILHPDITEMFPPGWEERLEPMPGFYGVFFLEVADLAVAKLHAGRPKDVELLAHLLREGLLEASMVRERLGATPLGGEGHREALWGVGARFAVGGRGCGLTPKEWDLSQDSRGRAGKLALTGERPFSTLPKIPGRNPRGARPSSLG